MKVSKEDIARLAEKKGKIKTSDIAGSFDVSRQYAHLLLSSLVADGILLQVGFTRNTFYVLPAYASGHPELFPAKLSWTLSNKNLEEHIVLAEIERNFLPWLRFSDNVKSIFTFAFSEMLNNAIEHSESKRIGIEVVLQGKSVTFAIRDFGIGVFRNIMRKRHLENELEAVQDLLKGKTTTMPQSHSGEGIFFTSKIANLFILESFGRELRIDNTLPDVFVREKKSRSRGTKVSFSLPIDTTAHLSDVFRKYTNQGAESDFGFDKTEIRVKLYTRGGIHISRSQARRILSGLEKFKVIVFDFEKVAVVGQAFADEIFRVFHQKNPSIELEVENAAESVQFMIERVDGANQKTGKLFGK